MKSTKPNLRIVGGIDYCDGPRCEDEFGTFMRLGWNHANEPSQFIPNWHIDCMVDHFTAAVDRTLGANLLIFTMPPRHNKTMGGAVFLPAWTWCQNPDPGKDGHGLRIRPNTWRGPGTRFMFISYGHSLSKEPSEKCLALIKSDWYQKYWHHRFTLTSEGFINSATTWEAFAGL
jgi:hypothetical protein